MNCVNKEPQKGVNTLIILTDWELRKCRNFMTVDSVVWLGEIGGVGRDPVASCRLWRVLPGYKNLDPDLVVAI